MKIAEERILIYSGRPALEWITDYVKSDILRALKKRDLDPKSVINFLE